MRNSETAKFNVLFLGVLVAGMLITSCTDSPVSSADKAELNASSLTSHDTGTVDLVFISDESVDSWDPILPASEDKSWPTTVCRQDGSIGLNAGWTNPHKAYNIRPQLGGLHAFEVWYPHHDFDAVWINAFNDDHSSASGGPGGHNWTKYEMPVSGDGDFVVQLLADNCSWIYLDGTLVGYQDESGLEDPNSGQYGVSLSGDHTLSFIIFDGGGAAGGKFRLETSESFGGTVPPIVVTNTAPVADAGADQTVEATGPNTTVNLDGSASSDADGDELNYSWTYNGTEISTVAVATANLPVGTHTFTLTVSDGTESDTDEVVVEIEDTTAPELSYTQQTGNLWPPNHKMVLVLTGISANDLVEGATEVNVTVTSNESSNGRGDGNTEQDYEIVTHADGTVDVYLRAERSGKGGGRTYTVAMNATDAAGNTASASVTASVAKSQGK